MHSFNDNLDYYRKLIVNHYINPTHHGFTNNINSLIYQQSSASCVDNFQVEIVISNNIVTSARFMGTGCAIATAATDLFCNLIEDKTNSQIKIIINNYELMLAKKQFDNNIIANLIAFKNVSRQPNRIKCALIGIIGIKKIL